MEYFKVFHLHWQFPVAVICVICPVRKTDTDTFDCRRDISVIQCSCHQQHHSLCHSGKLLTSSSRLLILFISSLWPSCWLIELWWLHFISSLPHTLLCRDVKSCVSHILLIRFLFPVKYFTNCSWVQFELAETTKYKNKKQTQDDFLFPGLTNLNCLLLTKWLHQRGGCLIKGRMYHMGYRYVSTKHLNVQICHCVIRFSPPSFIQQAKHILKHGNPYSRHRNSSYTSVTNSKKGVSFSDSISCSGVQLA